jgi:hypothetical protein
MNNSKLIAIGVFLIGLFILSPVLSTILDSIYNATDSDVYSPQQQAFRQSLKFGADFILFMGDIAPVLAVVIVVIIYLYSKSGI